MFNVIFRNLGLVSFVEDWSEFLAFIMRSGRFVELCAFLVFLSYIPSHGSNWLGAYDDFTADVRTRQFVWADSTLLEFFLAKTTP